MTTPRDASAGGARSEPQASGVPRELGYRWPAEWEPHRATWLAWPHNPDTWPGAGRLARVRDVYVEMIRALCEHETVCLNVPDAQAEDEARTRLERGGVATDAAVRFHRIPTDDAWVRDHGAIFLVRDGPRPERALVDFGFNAWGGKYPPWQRDDAVPRRMAERLALPRFEAGFVLEGGSVDGNGRGALLTTESCLLNPNRGAGRTRERVEGWLADYLGARAVVWLGDGIAGDDTDGHVDDIARFVGPDAVVCAVEPDAHAANHAPLAENLRRLRAARDPEGKPFSVATLPMPPPLRTADGACPASYANFYLANGLALVPVFGAPADARALAVLGELLPGRELVPVPAGDLVVGFGAVHCLTQQEPA